jgi:hypothetical protein
VYDFVAFFVDSSYLAGNTFPYWESPFKTDVASLVAASNLDIWIV